MFYKGVAPEDSTAREYGAPGTVIRPEDLLRGGGRGRRGSGELGGRQSRPGRGGAAWPFRGERGGCPCRCS